LCLPASCLRSPKILVSKNQFQKISLSPHLRREEKKVKEFHPSTPGYPPLTSMMPHEAELSRIRKKTAKPVPFEQLKQKHRLSIVSVSFPWCMPGLPSMCHERSRGSSNPREPHLTVLFLKSTLAVKSAASDGTIEICCKGWHH